MKNFRLFILALSLVTFFAACKKDDAPGPDSISLAEKISHKDGKKWVISSMTAKYTVNGQSYEQDFLPIRFQNACLRDNIMVLYTDKKIETREGNVKCGSSDLISSGTWELKNNETEMHVSSGSTTLYSTIVEASATTIKTEYPQALTLSNGQVANGTIVTIYTAQ
jgi:hypothetical protein